MYHPTLEDNPDIFNERGIMANIMPATPSEPGWQL